ncbi:MAG: hypothetical protein FWE61_06730, partial [Micrococcales bacterium]|nr:hypothetical protein [Micrococcales bacterium]
GCTTPASSAPKADEARRAATGAACATQGLVRTTSGVYCLDLHDGQDVPQPARWWSALGPAARFFDVVVTDWGPRAGADLAAVAASSRVVVVTARADRPGMQRAVDVAAVCASLGVASVVVLVDVAGDRSPGVQVAVDASPVPAVLVPYDRAFAKSQRPGIAWDLAVLEAAACAVDVLDQVQAGAQPTERLVAATTAGVAQQTAAPAPQPVVHAHLPQPQQGSSHPGPAQPPGRAQPQHAGLPQPQGPPGPGLAQPQQAPPHPGLVQPQQGPPRPAPPHLVQPQQAPVQPGLAQPQQGTVPPHPDMTQRLQRGTQPRRQPPHPRAGGAS